MFKAHIKVKLHNSECMPKIHKGIGDWIDLRSAVTVDIDGITSTESGIAVQSNAIPLGVGIKLPYGMEALVLPRSSTFKDYGMIMRNNTGVIDNSYSGNDDVWHFMAVFLGNGKEKKINVGDRICQFRIQPSQFAPWWVKLKWLFTSGVVIDIVDNLNSSNRGGLGTTGNK